MYPDSHKMTEVTVLKDGYSYDTESGSMKADCSITLVRTAKSVILFETGLAKDKDFLLQALKERNLKCSDITHVICSHGHLDHVGNLNLFPHALCIVNYDVCRGDELDQRVAENLLKGEKYSIDENVDVLPTPGHTYADVSLWVRNSNLGSVLVAGDLFECEADVDNAALWQKFSEYPDKHLANRRKTVQTTNADYIVPGHGPAFRVTERFRAALMG